MDTTERRFQRQEYITKVILAGVYISAFGLVIWLGGRIAAGEFRPGIFDWILLSFASLRLARLVAYDVVMEPLRSPVAHTLPDHTGAGESVEARGRGVQRAFGQLISCPICVGTWIAALLTYALYLAPGPARLFLMAAATIGAAELLNGLLEALCWTGQLNRTLTGAELRRSEQHGEEPIRPAEAVAADGWDLSLREAVRADLTYTQDALCAALERLLAQKGRLLEQSATESASGLPGLRLEGVNIQGGEAIIYISGSVPPVEANPPQLHQIEATALQFSAVRRVSILLNGRPVRLARPVR